MGEKYRRRENLIDLKFREYFLTTLVTIGSASIAAIVDRILIGNLLDANALAACNLTGPIVFPINIIVSFFVIGSSTMAMTYKGRCDTKTADRFFTITMVTGTLVMLAFGLLCFAFCPQITDLVIMDNKELYQPVHDYFIPQFFQGIVVILVNGANVYMTVDGMRNRVMVSAFVTHLVNLSCDYIFMGPMHFGIMSAGWATNIGYSAGFLVVLPYFWSEKRSVHFMRLVPGDIKYVKEAVTTGMAPALSHFSLLVGTLAMNYIILASFGAAGMQILAVCSSGSIIASVFYFGSRQTILPIGGALYGEKDYNGLKSLMIVGMRFSFLVNMILFAVLELFPVQFAAVFDVKDSALMPLLVPGFRLFALSIPIEGAAYILLSFYQSTGHQTVANVLTVLKGIVCFVPVAFVLAYVNKEMVWLTYAIAPAISMFIILIYLKLKTGRQGVEGILLLEHEEEARVFDFTIPNHEKNAVEASERIRGICDENGIERTKGNIIALAAEELCTNTARHSYGKKSDVIDVFLKIYADKLILKVRDNGNIFNPTEYITPEGVEVSGLKVLKSLPVEIMYNRVLGFNTSIVTLPL